MAPAYSQLDDFLIATDRDHQLVHLQFREPVARLALSPIHAQRMAHLLLASALDVLLGK